MSRQALDHSEREKWRRQDGEVEGEGATRCVGACDCDDSGGIGKVGSCPGGGVEGCRGRAVAGRPDIVGGFAGRSGTIGSGPLSHYYTYQRTQGGEERGRLAASASRAGVQSAVDVRRVIRRAAGSVEDHW